MSAVALVVLVIEVVAAALLAPLVTGVIQTTKARLQGRLGPSPFQPYRELRRLWGKSCVNPAGTTVLYRLAPAIVVAAVVCCLVVVAAAVLPPAIPLARPLGSDFILILGLLALARVAVALSAWDTGQGFGLLGAARDLFVAISAEVLMMLTLVLAALPAGSTDLRDMHAAGLGTHPWQNAAHWCGLVAFSLVAITEMGRQPVDNPDTHLELTMIHEGPLLEYAGRDLAYLQWAAAAKHVIMISLLIGVFLPLAGDEPVQIAATLAWFVVAVLGVAFVESFLAKMRLLRVPAFLATGSVVALVGLVTWFVVPAS